jgi:hypothetical protein
MGLASWSTDAMAGDGLRPIDPRQAGCRTVQRDFAVGSVTVARHEINEPCQSNAALKVSARNA